MRKMLVILAGVLLVCGIAQAQGHVDITFNHRVGHHHKNIGNEVVYQIVVDRFANGNFANDCSASPAFCANGDYLGDWIKYQGGDLRGVINKLDYIAKLGATRIWLTPVFENLQVSVYDPRFDGHGEFTSYHGYWIKDWFRLNPFFTDHGSTDYAIMDEMIKAGKTRGIRFYLDTVVNHTSPIVASDWSLQLLSDANPLSTQSNVPRSYLGALFREGNYVTSYTEDRYRALQFGHIPSFHQSGLDIGAHGESDWHNPYIVENHNLLGLADLNQDAPLVADYLRDAHDFWMERFPDLAGYRMDTVKHVSNAYWKKFSDHIYGRFPNLEMIGEYYNGGVFSPLSMDFYKQTQMSMLDFDFRYALVDVFLFDQGFQRLSEVWARDADYGDASALFTYLDSHDHARLRGEKVNGRSLSYDRMRIAIATWLMSRGIPTIYYGIEQDLFTENDRGDPFNRPMMRQFNEDHELYQMMQKLIALRKRNPAVRYGSTHVVHQTQHLMAFERVDHGRVVLFAVSKNPRQGQDVFSLHNVKMPDGVYRDDISGKTYEVKNGSIQISLGYGEFLAISN